MVENKMSSHSPLIPMSEMFMSAAPAEERESAASKGNSGADEQACKNTATKGSLSYALEQIDREIAGLTDIQSNNNEEVKKRLTEIQSLRENNLVVVGAIGGLKKLREKL